MKLEAITPLLITLDEAPNLPRTLAGLAWAHRIVAVDSGSTDGTRELLAADPRIELLDRSFDCFAAQVAFGLEAAGRGSDWVLSLDADHVAPPELGAELAALDPSPAVGGYRASFRYWSLGRPLRGSLYPPRTVLCRPERARVVQDGHAHRIEVAGDVLDLVTVLAHDDRKPSGRWLAAQQGYARQEVEKLLAMPARQLGWPDRLRRWGWVAPWAAPLWALLVKRALFDGPPGWYYAGQRAIAELLLALRLFEARLERGRDVRSSRLP